MNKAMILEAANEIAKEAITSFGQAVVVSTAAFGGVLAYAKGQELVKRKVAEHKAKKAAKA